MCQYSGSGPHGNNLISAPTCAPVESFPDILNEVSVPAVTVHSELCHILPRSMFEGIDLFAKGIKHHQHAIVLIQHL